MTINKGIEHYKLTAEKKTLLNRLKIKNTTAYKSYRNITKISDY